MRQILPGKILLIVISFFIFLFSFKDTSSQSQFLDIVWLKNGQYIKGLIISGSTNEKFKIIDIYGREYSIEWAEIDRIEKDNYTKERFLGYAKNYIDSSALNKPYSLILKGGFMRVMNAVSNNVNFNIIASYSIKNFSIGVGGMYSKIEKNQIFPIYLDGRYTFNYTAIKPFFFVNTGYGLGSDGKKGGMFAMGAGVRYQLTTVFSILTDISYYYQAVDYESQGVKFKIRYDCALINAGIQF
ncbi:MAG TPA: hypothetical protein VHP32_12405 [Ignavibacteria bacterium]|nr:hypothetical protein [Ignavibacteria bacterium]